MSNPIYVKITQLGMMAAQECNSIVPEKTTAEINIRKPQSISINPGLGTELILGESRKFRVSVSPSIANVPADLFWECTDDSILRLEPNGTCLALSRGEVTVSVVSVSNQDLHSSCTISVSGPNDYTLTVESEDIEKGTVSGSGKYAPGSKVTISAFPAEGFEFLSWDDGNTESVREIILTGNCILTASFGAHNIDPEKEKEPVEEETPDAEPVKGDVRGVTSLDELPFVSLDEYSDFEITPERELVEGESIVSVIRMAGEEFKTVLENPEYIGGYYHVVLSEYSGLGAEVCFYGQTEAGELIVVKFIAR